MGALASCKFQPIHLSLSSEFCSSGPLSNCLSSSLQVRKGRVLSKRANCAHLLGGAISALSADRPLITVAARANKRALH